MLGDTREDNGEPSLRIDVVELGGDDEGLTGGSALPAAIRAGEHPALSAQGDVAQGAFGGVVGEAYAAIIHEARECLPALQHKALCVGGLQHWS